LSLRSYSLWIRDGDQQALGVPEFIRAMAVASGKQSLRVLRVLEALRAADREDAIEPLYLEWGARAFVPGPPQAPTAAVLEEALAAAGLEGSWLSAAADPRWNQAIETSMARLGALSALAGGAPVVPTLTAGQQVLFRGAVLSAPGLARGRSGDLGRPGDPHHRAVLRRLLPQPVADANLRCG
jgi:hypothetical protein